MTIYNYIEARELTPGSNGGRLCIAKTEIQMFHQDLQTNGTIVTLKTGESYGLDVSYDEFKQAFDVAEIRKKDENSIPNEEMNALLDSSLVKRLLEKKNVDPEKIKRVIDNL